MHKEHGITSRRGVTQRCPHGERTKEGKAWHLKIIVEELVDT
jgi:hypothetical protein